MHDTDLCRVPKSVVIQQNGVREREHLFHVHSPWQGREREEGVEKPFAEAQDRVALKSWVKQSFEERVDRHELDMLAKDDRLVVHITDDNVHKPDCLPNLLKSRLEEESVACFHVVERTDPSRCELQAQSWP